MSVRHGQVSLSEHEIEFIARAVADAPLVTRSDAPVRMVIARKLLALKDRMALTAGKSPVRKTAEEVAAGQ